MEKLMQLPSSNNRARGMTLIEVLIALMIVSFVFSSLTQMTFDALKRAKKLELQDKMRNYATEAVQVIYYSKDSNWTKTFSDTDPNVILPPATLAIQKTQAYLYYDPSTKATSLKSIDPSLCQFNSTKGNLEGSSCVDTMSAETADTQMMFGRIIIRTDDNIKNGGELQDTDSDAELEVVVACIEERCSGLEYTPFRLSLKAYRTGGTQ